MKTTNRISDRDFLAKAFATSFYMNSLEMETEFRMYEFCREMAHFIILQNFTFRWLATNFYPGFSFTHMPESDRTDGIFRAETMSKHYFGNGKKFELEKYIKTTRRLTLFAESLYNLQSIPNYDFKINESRSHGKTNNGFEGVIAEWFVARYLFLADMDIEFNTSSDREVGTYDIKSHLTTGEEVGCESKSCVGVKNFSFYTMAKKYKEAKPQIGKRKRVIFIKAPFNWQNTPAFEKEKNQIGILDKLEGPDISFNVFWEYMKEKNDAIQYGVTLSSAGKFEMGTLATDSKLIKLVYDGERLDDNPKYMRLDKLYFQTSGKALPKPVS